MGEVAWLFLLVVVIVCYCCYLNAFWLGLLLDLLCCVLCARGYLFEFGCASWVFDLVGWVWVLLVDCGGLVWFVVVLFGV